MMSRWVREFESKLRAWWSSPTARERVLFVLASAEGPLSGREIARRSELGFIGPYPLLWKLEEEGLVESREAPEQAVVSSATGRVYRRRLYWLREVKHAS